MVQMKGADSNRLGAAVAAGILLSAAGSAPVPAAFADEAPAIVKETTAGGQWRYSEFINQVNGDNVEKVTFSSDGQQLLAIDTDGGRHKLEAIPNDPELLNTLTSHKVDVTVLPQEANAGGPALDFLQSLIFPTVLLGGLFFLSRGAGGGMGGMGGMGGGPMDFGKSQAQVQMNPDTGVTFEDVAGCDQAKLELEETVDFLKNPERYTNMGAKIPRGVLLDGPPGTGKTLLAKAVAGEAGVPFFAVSGSEFVEMFVGVGASRVRDLFGQAKKNAPCIIFIDEIDAVGRQRGAGFAGGNDEREQTLNQILTEMDGFDGNPGIITIAATNRADILDNALTRPGRFDRKVTVDLPDFKGRTAILKVHARGKPLERGVDLEGIARRTPGFSGASLQNLLNEAAIYAARQGKSEIGYEEIDAAVDRNMVGLEKKDAVQTLQRKELVAFHEAGHAVCGAMIPDYDMVQKITIIPRSNGAGGLTFFAPSESRLESGLYSKQYLEGQLAVALGGRLAEELVYGDVDTTTGASNDLQQVASIARRMVMEWGMSDKVGPIGIQSGDSSRPFMGRAMNEVATPWSKEIVKTASDEVDRLVNNAYVLAKKLLMENRDLLDALAAKLMEQETVSAEEFQVLINKYGKYMSPYSVFGESYGVDALPFQEIALEGEPKAMA
jgi:cell division protease FtsH